MASVVVPLLMFTKQNDDRVVVVVPGQFRHEHGTAGAAGIGVEDHEILPVGAQHVCPTRIGVGVGQRVLVEQLAWALDELGAPRDRGGVMDPGNCVRSRA